MRARSGGYSSSKMVAKGVLDNNSRSKQLVFIRKNISIVYHHYKRSRICAWKCTFLSLRTGVQPFYVKVVIVSEDVRSSAVRIFVKSDDSTKDDCIEQFHAITGGVQIDCLSWIYAISNTTEPWSFTIGRNFFCALLKVLFSSWTRHHGSLCLVG